MEHININPPNELNTNINPPNELNTREVHAFYSIWMQQIYVDFNFLFT
jgi:hypothetical protein